MFVHLLCVGLLGIRARIFARAGSSHKREYRRRPPHSDTNLLLRRKRRRRERIVLRLLGAVALMSLALLDGGELADKRAAAIALYGSLIRLFTLVRDLF